MNGPDTGRRDGDGGFSSGADTTDGDAIMDGRGIVCFALAAMLGIAGCIPGQNKITTIETPRPPAEAPDDPVPSKSLNPFAEQPKREPKLELAMATLCERNAAALKDNPEKQFRQLDDARKMYQEILNYDPRNIEAFRGLTRVYIAQRDFARASATMQKAIEVHPSHAQLFADWSVVHSKQSDFAGALAKLTKAREIDPENQEFMKMMGVNLVCSGQVDAGIEMLTRARGRAAAHYYVARLYKRTGQIPQARRHVEMALEANPNFADANTLLTELNARPTSPSQPSRNVGLQFVSDDESVR